MTEKHIDIALEWCEQFEHNIVVNGSGDKKCVQALQMMVVIKHALRDYKRPKVQNKMKSGQDIADFVHLKKKEIKAEAIREFAERLKKESFELNSHYDFVVEEKTIDNIAKKMCGGEE